MLRVSCKVSEPFLMLNLQETRSILYSMNRPKKNLLQLIFTFYHKYLKYKNYLKFRKQNSFVFNTESYIKRFCQSVIQEAEEPP